MKIEIKIMALEFHMYFIKTVDKRYNQISSFLLPIHYTFYESSFDVSQEWVIFIEYLSVESEKLGANRLFDKKCLLGFPKECTFRVF